MRGCFSKYIINEYVQKVCQEIYDITSAGVFPGQEVKPIHNDISLFECSKPYKQHSFAVVTFRCI
jgi:hypothetical protein